MAGWNYDQLPRAQPFHNLGLEKENSRPVAVHRDQSKPLQETHKGPPKNQICNAQQVRPKIASQTGLDLQENRSSASARRDEWEAALGRALSNANGDLIEVWAGYLEWARQLPQADQALLMKRACSSLTSISRYNQDIRLLRLLVKTAEKDPRPGTVFALLEARGIGTEHALLYEAWSHSLETTRQFEDAAEVYKRGLASGAQPIDRLRARRAEFDERMRQRAARLASNHSKPPIQQQQHQKQHPQQQQTKIHQQQQQLQPQRSHELQQRQQLKAPFANAQGQLHQRCENVDKQNHNLAQLQQISPASHKSTTSGSSFSSVKEVVASIETNFAKQASSCHDIISFSRHSSNNRVLIAESSGVTAAPQLPTRSSAFRQVSEQTDAAHGATPRVQWDLGQSKVHQQQALEASAADLLPELQRSEIAPSTRLTVRKKVGFRAAAEEVPQDKSAILTDLQQSLSEMSTSSAVSRKRTLEVEGVQEETLLERSFITNPPSEKGSSEEAVPKTKRRRFGGLLIPLTNLFGSRTPVEEDEPKDTLGKSPEEAEREQIAAAAAAEREAEASLRAETLQFGLEAMGQQLIEEREADEVFEDVVPEMPPVEPVPVGLFSWLPFGRN